MTVPRSSGALWFLAGALLAVLAMRFGPVREVEPSVRLVVQTEQTSWTVAPGGGGGVLIGP